MRPQVETLIKILSEWVMLSVGKIGAPEGIFDVEDFMNATDILMKLKGVKSETWTVADDSTKMEKP